MNRQMQQSRLWIAMPFGAGNLLGRLRKMAALARQRRNLAELPDHLLNDIGITANEAKQEAARASWDVPTHWRG